MDFNSLQFEKAERDIQTYFLIVNNDLVNRRKEEIRYPSHEEDNNVGGGKANNNLSKTELIAIKMAEDKCLKTMNNIIQNVMQAAQLITETDWKIIAMIYSGNNKQTDKSVAHQMNMTKKEVKECRNNFIEILARVMGYI